MRISAAQRTENGTRAYAHLRIEFDRRTSPRRTGKLSPI